MHQVNVDSNYTASPKDIVKTEDTVKFKERCNIPKKELKTSNPERTNVVS